ncbi:unnamed protein product [Adineta steineri]|uniref:NAD(P)(+)--arginine ADP-ribosyltransferase n=1 Tax=Adineta steineri TaxID=433720 RepID=A0A819VHU4_9BILA|nr:unnamed protein product [Adineta steineri]CAF4109095.1 unnamed protein product [Adineta steineri]
MGNKKPITSIQTNTQADAKHVSTFSKDAVANRRINMQRMQNILVIWLDKSINDNNADCSNIIKQLKCIVNNVNTFTDEEQCIEFIQTTTNNQICMIVSGSLGQHIVPHVHNMSQVDTIFIFCNNQEWHKPWAKQWPKIEGVFTDVISICLALKQAVYRCEQNAISISFMASNKKFDQLDPSFMYTQILKEILLTINFEDKHVEEFTTYCRDVYDDEEELKIVNQLQTTYNNKIPIWWYTWDAFLYRMLNQALRLIDVDIIVRMGFFINDLHRDIQRLHSEQSDSQQPGETFTVYRGQCLPKEDFIEMTKTKDGFISFNNFLSTSKKRDVALNFAQKATTNPDLVGILFIISINPTDSTTPFAFVSDVSCFHTEDEVLFSMHTIFRIGDNKPMDGSNHLHEVNLTLTSDNDQDIRTLTDCIRQETFPDDKGWYRLGLMLRKMGEFTKAQEVYEILVHQTTDESEKAHIYHQLGGIKDDQGEYQEALTYYEKSLAIYQKILPSDHLNLAHSYNNIGVTYKNMDDYSKALLSYEKALAIRQRSLSCKPLDLAHSYNNIGGVYNNIGDYPKALSNYEEVHAIRQRSLPSNHPSLGDSYNNIGSVYFNMGDYPKALLSHEKALAIRQQSLLSNHPDLASSYMGIGSVYFKMGDYPKALSNYEKVLVIRQQSLPSKHPDVAHSYNNIGGVYFKMGDYPKALLSHEKALAIRQQSLSSNHPDLAHSYDSIGGVYNNMGDDPKALLFHEKALAIRQQSLLSNRPDLTTSYYNIGLVNENIGNNAKAHSFYELAVQTGQQSLPTNHPNLKMYKKSLQHMKKKIRFFSVFPFLKVKQH